MLCLPISSAAASRTGPRRSFPVSKDRHHIGPTSSSSPSPQQLLPQFESGLWACPQRCDRTATPNALLRSAWARKFNSFGTYRGKMPGKGDGNSIDVPSSPGCRGMRCTRTTINARKSPACAQHAATRTYCRALPLGG